MKNGQKTFLMCRITYFQNLPVDGLPELIHLTRCLRSNDQMYFFRAIYKRCALAFKNRTEPNAEESLDYYLV